MEIKQQLKLSQQLVMTPQLQQAIRLLQLSRLELIDEIRKELDANPVLADDDIDPSGRREQAERELPAAQEERVDRMEDRMRAAGSDTPKLEEKGAREIDWEQFLENRTLQQALPANRGGFEELPPIEQNLSKATSLVDHLRWQLQLSDFTDTERRFAELVLGNLDDSGFLDLKGIERDNGEKTPDITIEEL
jgi:RNA polymerase sigma-54 factor